MTVSTLYNIGVEKRKTVFILTDTFYCSVFVKHRSPLESACANISWALRLEYESFTLLVEKTRFVYRCVWNIWKSPFTFCVLKRKFFLCTIIFFSFYNKLLQFMYAIFFFLIWATLFLTFNLLLLRFLEKTKYKYI